MDTLELLGVALGLAALAGINLYLTVFVTGLAIQQQWIQLSPAYSQLSVLAHPWIITFAGVLYFIEFFADKIPWVDSLWDSIHTVIRPIGGAMLAIRVLGTSDPFYDILIVLLTGTVSLMTHGMKAGTRLIANGSPEPISNIALSVTEDIGVIGGLALILYNPLLALGALLLLFAAVFFFAPRIFRAIKARVWLIGKKLNAPAINETGSPLPDSLPEEFDVIFNLNSSRHKILWAVPCLSGGAPKIPAYISGYLIASADETRKLYFVGKRGWRPISVTLELETYKASHEPKFLSDNLLLSSLEKSPKFLFLFDRTKGLTVKKLVESLEERLGTSQKSPAPTYTDVTKTK